MRSRANRKNNNDDSEEEVGDFISKSVPVDKAHLPKWMLAQRTRILTSEDIKLNENSNGKSVIYWMQRDVRTADNWALLYAGYLAKTLKVPLHVVHVLPPPPASTSPGEDQDGDPIIPSLIDMPMTERHGTFLLGGLELVHKELDKQQVGLHVLMPLSHRLVGKTFYTQIVEELHPSVVICDFSPMRHFRQWTECQTVPLLSKLCIPMWQVDTHNVVPVWHASGKREVGARTLRPKIHKHLQDCLQKFPDFEGNDHMKTKDDITVPDFNRKGYEDFLQMDTSVQAVAWAKPGTEEAKKQFLRFVERGLPKYETLRNDPTNTNISSDLSPWLNHGHISFQRITMAVKKLNKHAAGCASFIEEGVVRKELSDNMLFYSPNDYDQLSTAAAWAQDTLRQHANDKREWVYTLEELAAAETHDDLWNAAQLQVVREGRMHGFMRMYWAKKVLEWTKSPEYALSAAQYLNDRFALDGKDPNGFIGVGWSIMGIHDQGWKERDIFGKIRYMNYAGCKRKFNVANFVKRYKGASENAFKAEAKHKQTDTRGKKRKLVQSTLKG